MKKTIALLIMLVMMLSILPAIIAEESEVEDTEDTIVITGTNIVPEPVGTGCNTVAPDKDSRDACCQRKGYKEWSEEENDCVARSAPTPIITTIRAEYQEKLEQLDAEQQEKLTNLQQEYARKVFQIKSTHLDKIAELSEDEIEKLASLDRSRLQEYSEKSAAELREALQKVTVTQVKKEEAYRERVVTQSKTDHAEANYNQAVSNYNQAKRSFEKYKEAWLDAIDDGDEEAAINNAKRYLGHAADMIIESLEKVKAKVEANDDFTEDEAAEAIADLDEKIAHLLSLKTELDAATTKEEVKTVGKKILAAWERTRYRLQVHAEHVVRTQVGEILSRSEALEKHLDRILALMEEEGIDVEDLDEKVDAFSDLIASARDKFEESKELFKQAKDEDDRDAFKKSKELSREAHNDLKEAHIILMELVRLVKAQGYDVEDNDEYVEVIEIDDDEEDETSSCPAIASIDCDADEVLYTYIDEDDCTNYECVEDMQSIDMVTGWNWISTHIEPEEEEFEMVFADIIDDVDEISMYEPGTPVGDGGETVYDGTWYVEDFDPKMGYKVKTNKATTLKVYGERLSSGVFVLEEGWNFVAYWPEEERLVSDVFRDLLMENANVKSQTESTTYYDETGWFGDFKMKPGQGYMVYVEGGAFFDFYGFACPENVEPTCQSGEVLHAYEGAMGCMWYECVDDMQSIDLVAGWNWVSTRIAVDDDDFELIFAPIADDIDQIVMIKPGSDAGDSKTIYSGDGEWLGYEMKPYYGYKIKTNKATTLEVYGEVETDGIIDLEKGWNMIGYLPTDERTVVEVFGDHLGADAYVKSLTESSTYYEGTGWFPATFTMEPGVGYVVFVEDDVSFDYFCIEVMPQCAEGSTLVETVDDYGCSQYTCDTPACPSITPCATGYTVETGVDVAGCTTWTCAPEMQSVDMVTGWNWVSVNIDPANDDIEEVFAAIIDDTEQVTIYDPGTETGVGGRTIYDGTWSESTFDPLLGYKVQTNKPTTWEVYGSTATGDFNLETGWNMISYLPDDERTIVEVFGDTLGDLANVKSLTTSTTYYEGSGWFPNTFVMEPGVGYMVYVPSDVSFAYS